MFLPGGRRMITVVMSCMDNYPLYIYRYVQLFPIFHSKEWCLQSSLLFRLIMMSAVVIALIPIWFILLVGT